MKKATQQQTKTHNQRLILKTIYNLGPLSRADIARATHLTRTTVSDLVGQLIEDGLVEEVGYGPSEGGKPPILLKVIDDSRHLIGIDLANSQFQGAVIDLRGKIVHRVNIPVDDHNCEAALELVYELVEQLIAAATSPLLGIGIGTPGLMDAQGGVVRKAVNLDWQDLPLRDLLKSRYDLPVYIANDSQVAALGEYTFGHGQDNANLVVVKAGQGIGAGIVLKGQLYYGDGSGAGEIGHIKVIENGMQCRCGNFGCLETVTSSRFIVKQARTIAQTDVRSYLHQYAATPEAINTEVVLQGFAAGDEALRDLICEVGMHLGLAVANTIGLLNIHRIIIAGSVARFGEPLIEVIRQQLQQSALTMLTNDTKVGLSDLGQDIVILGASALLLAHELELV
jgi:glucokinase-like ROK family protein